MVISFSLDKPFNHLIDKGYVYTFRINKRKRVGKDWFNTGRLQKKSGDCTIYLIKVFESDDDVSLAEFLYKYALYSGFDSRLEWIEAIVNLNNNRPVYKGYLYRVDLR